MSSPPRMASTTRAGAPVSEIRPETSTLVSTMTRTRFPDLVHDGGEIGRSEIAQFGAGLAQFAYHLCEAAFAGFDEHDTGRALHAGVVARPLRHLAGISSPLRVLRALLMGWFRLVESKYGPKEGVSPNGINPRWEASGSDRRFRFSTPSGAGSVIPCPQRRTVIRRSSDRRRDAPTGPRRSRSETPPARSSRSF